MKKQLHRIILMATLSIFGLSNIANAQNVNIPDANFKAYLVGNTSINTNGDGEIQFSEAVVYSGSIITTYLGISDLTGLEAFVSLNYLDCSGNQLTNLDVSANTALTELHCVNNQLTSINVTENTTLIYLNCGLNQLSNLDVSNNIGITNLNCQYNQLTNLDVLANTALTNLYCNNNQLTNLNVKNGNNTNLLDFSAFANPNLSCIQVDNAVWSTVNWTNIDLTASFSEDCSTSATDIETGKTQQDVFPNPNNGIYTITNANLLSKLVITNILGETIYLVQPNSNNLNIDMSNHQKGVYFLNTYNGQTIMTKIIIIQ